MNYAQSSRPHSWCWSWLAAVAEMEAIAVSEEDLTKLVEMEAGRTKKSPQAVRAAWQKEGRWTALESHLRRNRVPDFLAGVGHIQKESE